MHSSVACACVRFGSITRILEIDILQLSERPDTKRSWRLATVAGGLHEAVDRNGYCADSMSGITPETSAARNSF